MSLDHIHPEPTLDQLADQFAADIGEAIDRYVRHRHPGDLGRWPGAAQRETNRRLRRAVAMSLIAESDERLHGIMKASACADDRISACLVNCTEGSAFAADGAVDDFAAACDEEVGALRSDLIGGPAGRVLGESA